MSPTRSLWGVAQPSACTLASLIMMVPPQDCAAVAEPE